MRPERRNSYPERRKSPDRSSNDEDNVENEVDFTSQASNLSYRSAFGQQDNISANAVLQSENPTGDTELPFCTTISQLSRMRRRRGDDGVGEPGVGSGSRSGNEDDDDDDSGSSVVGGTPFRAYRRNTIDNLTGLSLASILLAV